jgi:hypothetical protein
MVANNFITFYKNGEETIKPKIQHLLDIFDRVKESPMTKTCEAMDRHGSNKNHRQHVIYTPFYDALFANLNPSGVLEFGIGSQDPTIAFSMNGQACIPGGSLRAWKELFPNAEIFGADIDKNCLFKEDRISTYYVNALESISTDQLWEYITTDHPNINIQLIIDDAYHSLDANLTLLNHSIDHLANNGWYVIEDINRDKPAHINGIKEWLQNHNYDAVVLDIPNNTNTSCCCMAVIHKTNC